MRCDVVIVGGGLTGCSAAYFLAKHGVDVIVVEQFDLNTQASGSNAGSIHAQIPYHRYATLGEDWALTYAPTIPLMKEAIALWKRLPLELGRDLEFDDPGGLLVARTDEQMAIARKKAALERAHGLPVEILSRADLRTIAPYFADDMIGAVYCPIEGKANPLLATLGMAQAASSHGARIMTQCKVLAIVRDQQGFAIATTRGTIKAARVLNCAGAAAGSVAAMAGITLPVRANPIQVLVTEPIGKLVSHLVYSAASRLTMKQARNGSVLIGGGWPARADPNSSRLSIDPRSFAGNLAAAAEVAPALAHVQIVRAWPAIVNGMDDWKPIIGEVPGHTGFYLAMVPWMGFTAGPLAGQLAAAIIAKQPTGLDLTAFSGGRYSIQAGAARSP